MIFWKRGKQKYAESASLKKTRRGRRWAAFFIALPAAWRRLYILLLASLAAAVIIVPIISYYTMTIGSTLAEQKNAFVEKVQEISQLTTAEAHTKVLVERTDNELFGRSINIDFPGTKRNMLIIIPGSVKAGIDLRSITESDMIVDEENKHIQLTVPAAQFLGSAELDLENAEVYSSEGLFRAKAGIQEGYHLANEAKKLIMEEAAEQGVLQWAETNAEKTLKELFLFAGYRLELQFKE